MVVFMLGDLKDGCSLCWYW